jgi:hypothetical protein
MNYRVVVVGSGMKGFVRMSVYLNANAVAGAAKLKQEIVDPGGIKFKATGMGEMLRMNHPAYRRGVCPLARPKHLTLAARPTAVAKPIKSFRKQGGGNPVAHF